MRFGVNLKDTPGSMAELLTVVAAAKANVLHIYHARNVKGMPLYTTRVDLELETRGPDHVEEITKILKNAGYHLGQD